MKRTLFLGANWKMNPVPQRALDSNSAYHSENPEVVAFPTFLDLASCMEKGLKTGAQCGRPEPSGAFTGDLGMKILADIGCTHVLCGHSERRRYHGETDSFVADQVASALRVGMVPILCIGETAEEHSSGKAKEVIKRQLDAVFSKSEIRSVKSESILIAYEPVWAISGGNSNMAAMSASEAQEIHAYIRSLLSMSLQNIRIIYGGSMKSSNAKELLSKPDIDGGLVGNASLNPEEFGKIVEIAKKIQK